MRLSVLTQIAVALARAATSNAGGPIGSLCQSGASLASPSLPLADRICTSECNEVAKVCYAAAGLAFTGTADTTPGTTSAIVACNTALTMCSSMCTKVPLTL